MIITAFKIQDDVTFFRQERLWSLRGAISERKCETARRLAGVVHRVHAKRINYFGGLGL